MGCAHSLEDKKSNKQESIPIPKNTLRINRITQESPYAKLFQDPLREHFLAVLSNADVLALSTVCWQVFDGLKQEYDCFWFHIPHACTTFPALVHAPTNVRAHRQFKLPEYVLQFEFAVEPYQRPAPDLPPGVLSMRDRIEDKPHMFNEPLNVSNFPATLQCLFLHSCPKFNHPIRNLPESLEILTLSFNFNEQLENLPPNLQCLVFGGRYNRPLPLFPPTLRVLHLGNDFDGPLSELPPQITHITFSQNFNQSVNNLPASLKYVTFGHFFNQPVDSLPSELYSIIFGSQFNQPVNNLPESLCMIYFSSNFNQSTDKLPSLLEYIFFNHSSRYNQPMQVLPSALKHLFLPASTQNMNLPPNLTFLHIGLLTPDIVLPTNLFCLFTYNLAPLQCNLRHLSLMGRFNEAIDHLPPTLEYLNLSHKFNHPVDHLPPRLISLKIGEDFNQPIDSLPSTLRYLSLGSMFNCPVTQLPPSLICLRFGHFFNQLLTTLPTSLKYLIFGGAYNQPLTCLPDTLVLLAVGSSFSQPPSQVTLPTNLAHLIVAFPKQLDDVPFCGKKSVCVLSHTFHHEAVEFRECKCTDDYFAKTPTHKWTQIIRHIDSNYAVFGEAADLPPNDLY